MLKELKPLCALSPCQFRRRATHVSCPNALPIGTPSLCHRLPNSGVTAVMGAYLVRTAACSVTVCPADGSAALTIFQSRDIASMHGRHNLCLRSRLPELHNSHF